MEALFDLEEFRRLALARRSMRAFLPRSVDDATLQEVFTIAGHAPSNCNTQPWHVAVVGGASADRMKLALMESIGTGHMQLDFEYDPSVYRNAYKERQRQAAKCLYTAADVARGDHHHRAQLMLRNLEFFDAPQAAFVFMPDWGGVREAADVGMYAQTLMLAMRAQGIGSCPQTFLSFNAAVVREQLQLDDSLKLLFGISFGYFDPQNPLNSVQTDRCELNANVTFFSD